MTTTESETETVKPLIDEATLDRLMAQVKAEGLDLLGPEGVLTELTSRIMNRAMEAELTDHLGYEHGDPVGHGSGNNRNGTSAKTVLTDAGAVPLKVPRDRNGEFEPRLVPKHTRRLEGFNDIVISLVSRGRTTRDVRAHLAAAYQVDISAELISKITDAVVPELRAWQARPLDAMYPVLYLDAIVVKVRTDGRVTNRPVYIAMAIDLEGCKHVLGLWLGNGDEGAKFWLGVLTELRNRGMLDVLIACCDGLTGFGDAIEAVWPQAVVQTSSCSSSATRSGSPPGKTAVASSPRSNRSTPPRPSPPPRTPSSSSPSTGARPTQPTPSSHSTISSARSPRPEARSPPTTPSSKSSTSPSTT